MPAVLHVLGRGAFWPFRPRYDPSGAERVRVVERGPDGRPSTEGRGLWASVARFVARAPRAVWVMTTVVLVALAGFSTQFEASGVEQSELVLGESRARDGQAALAEHFPGGSGSPAVVMVPTGVLDAAVAAVEETDGVAGVVAVADGPPSGTVPLEADGAPPVGPFAAVEPTEAQGFHQLRVTLADAADSPRAERTVRELRENLRAVDGEILVGGTTATTVDTDETSIGDRTVIIPVILVVITLILMLLLRSVLAPVLLLLTTVVSFFTALGVAALVFEHVLGSPGADPSVPLFGFVFLVQLAFIVAFGVLLDALVVRSLLVPALTYELGRLVWWPFHRGIGP